MRWTRTHTLIAGLTLILATNAVALVGVAYNRSGETESTLKLTERELHPPYGWGASDENSGISLTLWWRVLPAQDGNFRGLRTSYTGFGNAPDWLNKAKLAALDFDLPEPEDTPANRRYYDRILSKEVLLVLELDGVAYRMALERAQEHLQKEEALLKSNPDKKEFGERAKNARQELYQEQRINSRLFIVDAGLDVASLRAKYPDRNRYAIMRGQVQPQLVKQDGRQKLVGYVSGLNISEVGVPAVHRQAFESLRKNEYGVTVSPFEISLALGQRLEPWIIEARATR